MCLLKEVDGEECLGWKPLRVCRMICRFCRTQILKGRDRNRPPHHFRCDGSSDWKRRARRKKNVMRRLRDSLSCWQYLLRTRQSLDGVSCLCSQSLVLLSCLGLIRIHGASASYSRSVYRYTKCRIDSLAMLPFFVVPEFM